MQPMTIISFDEACGRSAIGDLGFVPKEYRGTVGEKLISAWSYGPPDSSSQRRRAMRPTFPSFAAGKKRRVAGIILPPLPTHRWQAIGSPFRLYVTLETPGFCAAPGRREIRKTG